MTTPIDYKSPEELRRLGLDDDPSERPQDQDGQQEKQHGEPPALQDDPFPPSSQRTRIAGLFQQLALWLDEASRTTSQPLLELKRAAEVCVELSHAVLEK